MPEKSVLNILVDKSGKIIHEYGQPKRHAGRARRHERALWNEVHTTTGEQVQERRHVGSSYELYPAVISHNRKPKWLKPSRTNGIPTDSIDGKESEFQLWVKEARKVNTDVKLAIKADEKTPYALVKKVMSELQDLSENRYYLITSYKKVED